ncbi:Trk system potassium transporter TrkA [Alphaproteobacteria bacterium]|jgi:trk system potassium uptake protein TrkA|nr:Trk system potassium transporter TrkA [Alphaproteobacteria bacterium]MDA9816576.1 Trk system potassium transporter TrkA [Alphaproteobacteria bacterium]MDA9914847.1 Trk system potassium transporter TrkA [Alphaproteobacteria bacterium]
MKQKIIICGAGRVGLSITEHLSNEGFDITVIDSNLEAIQKVTELYDVQGVLGLASYPNILEDAGIKDADMIIAVTQSDEINIAACQAAKSIFLTPTMIIRIRSKEYLDPKYSDFLLKSIGVNKIISPEDEVATAIVNQWRTPGAFDVAEFARNSVTMLGVSCKEDCPILDTPLRNLISLFPDLIVTVMAIIRGNKLIVPRGGEDIILSGDRVYLACPTNQINRTLTAFGHVETTAEKVTISGAGAIGIRVAEEIHKLSPETNLTMLELDKEIARYAAETLEYATVIHGDSLDPEIISEARLGQGETYIAATNNDEVNILSSLLAKRSGASHTVALINLPVFIPLFNSLDLEGVVSPPNLTASSILQEVRSGQIEHVHSIIEEFGDIISFEALKSSSIIGKPLKNLKLPKDVSLGAVVKKNDNILSPRGDTILEAGDIVVMFVPIKSMKKVEELLAVNLDFF